MKLPLIVLICVCIPFILNGQECPKPYTFDPLDTDSYSMSCGEITETSIKVSEKSCNFYTPLTSVGEVLDGDSTEIIYSVNFDANDLIDENDFIMIFLYEDGKTIKSKTIYGSKSESEYEFTEHMKISSGSSFRSRIAFICSDPNKYWVLKKGELTICIKDQIDTTSTKNIQIQNPLSAMKEREFVRLRWVTPANSSANYFKIERSTDGVQYSLTGFVKESNTTGATEYSFIDSRPDKPKTWYRVTQINNAGIEKIIGEPVQVYY